MHVGMTTFFQNLGRPFTDHEVYLHEVGLADMAEPLGFDSIWSAEHHFTDYTMCPSVTQFLTYMAGRTSRVQLGSMVVVLPWHEPVRVAEEISVLDNLSGGRVILGIGRGLGRVEFENFRIPMGESRERFTEYSDAILTGLETGYLEYDGKFYKQPRAAIRPAPLRSFRGRSYAASVSPQSLEIMCNLGVGLLIIAQKPWETTMKELAQYRERYETVNSRAAPQPIIASFVCCHEDAGMAEEMAHKYIRGYSQSALEHYEFHNEGLADIKGYEYYGALAQNIKKHGMDSFVNFLADLQVWGTPDQVFEKLVEFQQRTDAAGQICAFSFGGMPHDMARDNMKLFAEKVLPRLQAYDAGGTVGSAGDPVTVAAE